MYAKEPLKKVASDDSTRQKSAKKRSLVGLNEYFEQFFNAVISSAVVFQRFPNGLAKETKELAMLGRQRGW
ncbi:hypothetical protein B9K09_04625 [Pseudomonas sp. M30-35]|nr:hypothetical protein B9K09_04625 [Pseudomonas sp. M30-35]